MVAPNREIINISNSHHGKMHDKTLLLKERSLEKLPGFIPCLGDLGYLGAKKEFPNQSIIIPYKKKKGEEELPKHEKKFNKELNRDRVVVEHVIGDVKKNRILGDKYRSQIRNYDPIIRSIAALHNFKLKFKSSS